MPFAYLALAVAAIAEGTRLCAPPGKPAIRLSSGVAIVGLLLAFAGLLVRQLTGSEVYDAAASIAIGALLVAAAIRLGAGNASCSRKQVR